MRTWQRPLTVGELIEKLQEHPDYLPVCMFPPLSESEWQGGWVMDVDRAIDTVNLR